VSVWDDLYTNFSGWGQSLWNSWDWGVNSFYELGGPTLINLVGIIIDVLMLILYLPMRMFGVLIDLLNIILGSITGFMNTVIIAGNTLSTTFLGVFNGVMPSPWITALGTIILVNIVLRVYHYVKDIEILGNKL